MNRPMPRRTFLRAAAAAPLMVLGPMPAASAASNSTSGFGALRGESSIPAGASFSQGAMHAKFYEKGISVTRQGFTMSRKSTYALAKNWVHETGFPTGDVSTNARGELEQEFGTTLLTWHPATMAVGRVSTLGLVDYKKSPFKDVSSAHAHYYSIYRANEWGIVKGWPDGTFRPNEPVLRDAFAAFCYRTAGSPAYIPPTKSPFKDVPTSNMFYKEIAWLHAKGISRGWADGTFRPLAKIKRDAIAAMLHRMAPSNMYSFTPEAKPWFVDVPRTSSFHTEIAWMKATGISTGWTINENSRVEDWKFEFRPLADATRADAAAFLSRWNALFGALR